MGNYISSNANRFYAALESAYGQAAAISAANRFPAVKLQAQQVLERSKRLDKTGSRTFLGTPKDSRRLTAFQVRTYLTSWNGTGQPSYGPLFQSAMGGPVNLNSSLSIAGVQGPTQLQTTAAHGLLPGCAVAFGNEIRFVMTVPDASTMVINAPFSNPPVPTASLAPAVTYSLATALPSVTLYDYWDPAAAVSRMVTGAAVDALEISVNGDYHEFVFSGPAADLLDSSSFAPGSAGLASFPSEPALGAFDYSIVPGHLGQAWLGTSATQFFTLTEASIVLKNNIGLRNQEFGSSYPRAVTPGMRQVSTDFALFAQDDAQTAALYTAAKTRTPISAMLQLGQQQGQLMGILLNNIVPEIPDYNDSQSRLQWHFKNNLAQGTTDDEIYIAFA
ncbi:MAG TPA: phage tail tube protein [Bryobacteraceae bacterium]|nr:phage tail tube protein [Bryobacteraceae bacterium]